MMIDQYRQSTTQNRQTYLLRSRRMYRCHAWTVASLVLLSLTALTFVGLADNKPQKVEIVGGNPIQRVEVTGTLQLQQMPSTPSKTGGP